MEDSTFQNPKRGCSMQKVLLVAALLVLGGGLALAQTTVDLNWNVFGGDIGIDFQAGDDAYAGLSTGGFHLFGEFYGIDYDDNPYPAYNVDTVRTQVRASIEDGGYLEFIMGRRDSWAPMYGPAGQITYTYLGTSDTGFFATNTRTNFADMITHNYGFQSNSQWTASGNFEITHHIMAATEPYGAGFYAGGSGSINVTLMSSEVRGASSWRFGEGAGCYTNAHAEGTGSGTFRLWGAAPTELHAFGATIGGGSVALEILYNNGFSTANNLNMSGH